MKVEDDKQKDLDLHMVSYIGNTLFAEFQDTQCVMAPYKFVYVTFT